MQIKTKDAEQATFLWTHDDIYLQKIQTIQSSYKKIVFFVFGTQRKSQQILSLLNDYRNGKTLVQPKNILGRGHKLNK